MKKRENRNVFVIEPLKIFRDFFHTMLAKNYKLTIVNSYDEAKTKLLKDKNEQIFDIYIINTNSNQNINDILSFIRRIKKHNPVIITVCSEESNSLKEIIKKELGKDYNLFTSRSEIVKTMNKISK